MLAPGANPLHVALVAAALSIACSSKKSTEDRQKKPEPKVVADAAATAAVAADASASAVEQPAGDPFAAIGVEPCDDYIERQRSCVSSHAPAAIKDQQLDGLAHIATRWRRAAAAGAKEHLQTSCKSLLAASADATSAWKCKW